MKIGSQTSDLLGTFMVKRTAFMEKINEQMEVHRIVGLLGPRQCGKTTCAKEIFKERFQRSHYFDLEDPTDLERLATPKLTLQQLSGLIVIDEIQRLPQLFPVLRVLHDMDDTRQFLILGSASRDLIQQSSETLAGRIGYIELTPFNATEVDDLKKLWVQGGFPPSFLAKDEGKSALWRADYIRTFLERDIPNLGFKIPAQNLMRFWYMLAHYHGQTFNAAELGGALGLSGHTMRHYLDILVGTFMIRTLTPWIESLKKRQIKSPKIYFRDAGIFHALLDIKSFDHLMLSPKIGASWEGFALETIVNHMDTPHCYFWATHNHAELDLLVIKEGKRLGFEFKYTDKPSATKSMHIALSELKLDHLTLIYPGDVDFPLAKNMTVQGLTSYLSQHIKH